MIDVRVVFYFFLMIRRPPRSTGTDTLLPYTTLFRSAGRVGQGRYRGGRLQGLGIEAQAAARRKQRGPKGPNSPFRAKGADEAQLQGNVRTGEAAGADIGAERGGRAGVGRAVHDPALLPRHRAYRNPSTRETRQR